MYYPISSHPSLG